MVRLILVLAAVVTAVVAAAGAHMASGSGSVLNVDELDQLDDDRGVQS